METILRLLLLFLSEARPGERLSAGASRMTAAAVFSVAAILTLTAAIACAVAALWIWLGPLIGGPGAALASAGALLIVAGIFAALSRARVRENGQKHAPEAAVTPEILAEAQRIFADNKLAVLLAAIIAGMALGGSSRR